MNLPTHAAAPGAWRTTEGGAKTSGEKFASSLSPRAYDREAHLVAQARNAFTALAEELQPSRIVLGADHEPILESRISLDPGVAAHQISRMLAAGEPIPGVAA